MNHIVLSLFSVVMGLFLWGTDAPAFSGFYVGKADTKLFNTASEVVIAAMTTKP